MKQAGFTLAELVIVSLLLAILATVLYAGLGGIISSRTSIESKREASQNIRTILFRLQRELAGAVPEPLYHLDQSQEQRARPFFMGIDARDGSRDNDSIRFVTAAGAEPVMGGFGNFGLVEVGYKLAKSTNAKGERLMLIREEMPWGDLHKEVVEARRLVFPVGDNVISLNFRYRSRGTWHDSWMTVRSGLPEAVEVTLGLQQTDNSVGYYRTAFTVRPQVGRSRLFGQLDPQL